MNLLEETIQDFYENCDDSGQSEYAVPRLIYSLALAQRPQTAVEIGSNMGLCSLAIASALKFNAEAVPSAFLKRWKADWHPVRELKPVRGKLYCIDPVKQPHFQRRYDKFPLKDHIEFIQDFSDNVNPADLPPIDFLFIDGDHSYRAAYHDFANFFSRVTPGGYILIHDYFPNSPTPAMPWWGPNILTKQLREVFDLTDCLVVDTGFQSLSVFRKKINHIDYDFYSTSPAKALLQFYVKKYRQKLSRVFSRN